MLKRLFHSNLFRNIGVYTISNSINAAIPFLLLPILTRYLSPNEYGLTATFQSLVGFFAPLTGLYTQTVVIRKYYDADRVDLARYISTCLFILVASILLIAIVLIPLATPLAEITEFPKQWLWAVIATATAQYLMAVVLGIWQARSWVYGFAAYQNSQALANSVFTLLLVVALGMGWQGRVLAHTISVSFFALIALIYLRKMRLLTLNISKSYLKDALSFALPLIPYSFTGWVLLTMDRILINKLRGLEETGLYAAAFQICMVIMLVQQSFGNAWTPWFYEQIKKNEPEADRKIVRFSYLFVASNFLLALFLALAAPPLLTVFLGKEYTGAGNYLWWLALAQATNSIHIVSAGYVNLHYKNIYLMYAAVITTLIHIPLAYIFIKSRGSFGAAQAFFISSSITSLFTFFIATRLHKMPWLPQGKKA